MHLGYSIEVSSQDGKHMDIKRAGTQASAKGPSDWFTGTVRIDPRFKRLILLWCKGQV